MGVAVGIKLRLWIYSCRCLSHATPRGGGALQSTGAASRPANLNRGARILAVDGVDLINGNDVDTINAGLFPESDSESHDFTVMDFGSTEEPMLAMALQYRETGSCPTSSEKAQRKQGP